MKKIVFIFGLLIAGLLYAHDAQAGQLGGTYVWRTSYTETADNQVLISSEGILAFGGASVSTPTAATAPNGGFIYVYDAQIYGPTTSTITVINCGFDASPQVYVPAQVSSGLMYTKTGGCKATIYWDVLIRNQNVLVKRGIH